MASQPRTCAECGVDLYRRNRSGYCARHANSSPEKRAKVSAALRRAIQADPARRAALSRAGKVGASAQGESERRARRAREMRLWDRGAAARTPETFARISRSVSNVRMAWCPPDLRDEARRLTKSKGVPLVEVKAIIAEQHEAELRRFRRAIGAEEPPREPEAPPLNPGRLPRVAKGQTDPTVAAEIIAAIAFAFGFGPAEIIGAGRRNNVIPARQTCCVVLSRLGNSYAQIGRWLGGRDHSTIIESCRQFEARATPAMRELAERMIGSAA